MNTAIQQNEEFKVVIIEDEPEVAEIIALNLETSGATVYHGADGLTGCRLVGEYTPDVIVLDLLLPDMDGREICRIIRGHEDSIVSSTPIIMLTALGEADNREKGLALGANDYVAKPFSVKEVTMRVRNLAFERKRSLEQSTELEDLGRKYAELKDVETILIHEVKNKIITVAGLGALVEKRADDMSVSEIRKQARRIRQTGQYLESLADKLHELHLIDDQSNSVANACTELTGLMGKVVSLNRTEAEERGIKLEIDFGDITRALAPIPGDEAEFCISNLVENAVKYCPIMSTVALVIAERHSGWAVTVEDNGPGIPEELHKKVFERFFRGNEGAGYAPGSGLGLYMVKNVIERRGGTVSLKNGCEGGALFTLTLPRSG